MVARNANMPLRFANLLCAGFAFAAVLAATLEASAGGCLKNAREIKLNNDNVVRLSDYLCRSDRDAQGAARVQFQRLSGLAAGALLNGGTAPWQRTLYGNYKIANNEVLREYKNLLARFGHAVRERDAGGGENIAVNLLLRTPAQKEKGEPTSVKATKGAEVRSVELPGLPDIPLIDETIHILNERTWPASLNMYYTSRVIGPYKSPLEEMTVWRYLSPADAKDYSTRLQRYKQLLADRNDTPKVQPKSMQLLEYLTSEGWPETFLYASAELAGDSSGCVVMDFRTNGYSFVVDIAVIENVSSKPIQIDQLYGRNQDGKRLRQTLRSLQTGAESALQAAPITLAPMERLVVPLGLVFSSEPIWKLNEDKEKRKLSQERFRKITATAPETVFRSQVLSVLRGKSRSKNGTYVIQKIRESFKPPAYPVDSDFAFGPEWNLLGLSLAGEKISFQTAAPNLIHITADSEVGSCPILYAWADEDKTWVRYGKIIHQAQTPLRRATETISFRGLLLRFLIVEEELERATIAGVELHLDLTDGRTLTLLPDGSPQKTNNAGVIELYANEEIEIVFSLPPDLKPDDVVRSRLSVTGHYERYPALLIGRQ
jgi:hypothetical protein